MASFSTSPSLLAADRCRVAIMETGGKSRVSCVQNKVATQSRCVVSAISECQRNLMSTLTVVVNYKGACSFTESNFSNLNIVQLCESKSKYCNFFSLSDFQLFIST